MLFRISGVCVLSSSRGRRVLSFEGGWVVEWTGGDTDQWRDRKPLLRQDQLEVYISISTPKVTWRPLLIFARLWRAQTEEIFSTAVYISPLIHAKL